MWWKPNDISICVLEMGWTFIHWGKTNILFSSIPLYAHISTIEVTLLLNFTNRNNAGRKYQEDMDVNWHTIIWKISFGYWMKMNVHAKAWCFEENCIDFPQFFVNRRIFDICMGLDSRLGKFQCLIVLFHIHIFCFFCWGLIGVWRGGNPVPLQYRQAESVPTYTYSNQLSFVLLSQWIYNRFWMK